VPGYLLAGALTPQAINAALAAMALAATSATPGATGELTVSVQSGPSVMMRVRVPVLVFPRLVTVVTHTAGRVPGIKAMYESVQRWYPGTRLIASDDSKRPDEAMEQPVGPLQTWLRMPVDTGLAGGRNCLLEAVATPYVYLMDDDFTVQADSHLDLLLAALATSDFDIASAVIPQDIAAFVHFRGFINATADGDMRLRYGMYGRAAAGCAHVDFVPNVFMAKRAALLRSPWDAYFKLGEHEDFFVRAKEAGVRVLSCDHVNIHHNQFQWWRPSESNTEEESRYAQRRFRVYSFFVASLRKHGLKRLDSFGTIQQDLSKPVNFWPADGENPLLLDPPPWTDTAGRCPATGNVITTPSQSAGKRDGAGGAKGTRGGTATARGERSARDRK
jgi:GT2 family glycosyltransferase